MKLKEAIEPKLYIDFGFLSVLLIDIDLIDILLCQLMGECKTMRIIVPFLDHSLAKYKLKLEEAIKPKLYIEFVFLLVLLIDIELIDHFIVLFDGGIQNNAQHSSFFGSLFSQIEVET